MPGNQSLDFDDDGDSAAGTVLGRKVVISAQSGKHKVTKVEGMAFRADEVEAVIDAALDGTLGEKESDKAKFARLAAVTVSAHVNAGATA